MEIRAAEAPTVSAEIGEPAVCRVYGIPFAVEFPVVTPLPRTEVSPEFRLRRNPALSLPPAAECLYTSRRTNREGQPVLNLFREDDREYFRLADGTLFRVSPGSVEVCLSGPECAPTAEIFILGTLLTYLLERRGLPVLHAATVRVNGRAAAFLAGNGGGKSSLAAAFLQAGAPLISDDLLPVHRDDEGYTALSGYPQMRFWPAEARYFAGDDRPLARVHPELEKLRVPVGAGGLGTFSGEDGPLAAIYLPDRQPAGDAPIEILPVSLPEAVATLSRQLFLAPLLQDLGLMGERLRFFASLVRRVPVRRVRYPSGLEHLPAVVEAVRADLERRR